MARIVLSKQGRGKRDAFGDLRRIDTEPEKAP